MQIWIDLLINGGISKILINTHYLPNQVRDFIEQSKYRNKIELVHEGALLGTAGTLLANTSFFNNEPLLVAHADNLSLFNVNDFILAHEKRPLNCEMTMMLFETNHPESCGIVSLDNKLRVIEFHEKPKNPSSNLANAAIYVMERSAINYLSSVEGNTLDISLHLIPRLLGRIYSYMNNSYHRDIGTVDSYTKAQVEYRRFKDQFLAR
jgi:mannose-1-phosphate guanylyltransferase